MRIGRRPHRIVDEKNLVADQPGNAVFFSGLLIAIVLGLALRGVLAPTRIRALIENAAERIHPDVKVTLEGAHVSLARGPLPRFAVVIEKVRMEGKNPCWMSPRLYADEIRLPLSFWSLLTGGDPFHRIEANEVEIRLTEERKNCEGMEMREPVMQVAPAPSSGVTLVGRTSPKPDSPLKASGQIEDIEISRLILVSEVTPVVNVDLRDFRILLKSMQPRVIQMDAKTDLLKQDTGELLSHANLHVEYKEFPETRVEARVFGNWREGSYSLGTTLRQEDKSIQLQAELKHLPLGQLLETLNRWDLVKSDFSPRLSWLSFKAQAQGSYEKWKDIPAELRDLKLEGDLGEIEIEKLDLEKLEPAKFAPFKVEVRSLDLDRLVQFLKKEHPHPALNKLGQFRGIAEVRDPDNLRWKGDWNGIEFVFSNKGRREIQTIRRLPLDLSLDKGRWSLSAHDPEVDQGALKGAVIASGDRDLRRIDFQLKTEEMTLAPAVQKLMTNGGEIAPLKAELKLLWDQGKLQRLQGRLRWPLIRMEGLRIEQFNGVLDLKNDSIVFTPQVDRMALGADSPAYKLLQRAIQPAWIRDGALVVKNASGQFVFKDFKAMKWREIKARVDTDGTNLRSDGEWTPAGELAGSFEARGKTTKKYKLTGTRDNPAIEDSK